MDTRFIFVVYSCSASLHSKQVRTMASIQITLGIIAEKRFLVLLFSRLRAGRADLLAIKMPRGRRPRGIYMHACPRPRAGFGLARPRPTDSTPVGRTHNPARFYIRVNARGPPS
eukprot:363897-Chlamydomonas_euryale.AAC.29